MSDDERHPADDETTGPEPVVLAVAMDLVTRFQLRMAAATDSRLGELAGRYQLAAASWTGQYVALAAFYVPPDGDAAIADLEERCAQARRWAAEQMRTRRTCKRADVLLVALRQITGKPQWSGKRQEHISVGAAWIDALAGTAASIADGPQGLPSARLLAQRARDVARGAAVPTLAAVDLAERQGLAANYSRSGSIPSWLPSPRETGALARLRAVGRAARARDAGGGGNLGMSVGSFALSVLVVTQWWGPVMGVSIMLVTLCHEWGHMVTARLRGVPASAPTFIGPFGAFVRHAIGSESENAWIALAGPLAGAAAATVVLIAAVVAGSEELTLAASWAYGLTLINLIPFGPFDGARVFPSLAPVAVVVSLALAAGTVVALGAGDFGAVPLLSVFLVGTAVAAGYHWRNRVSLDARFLRLRAGYRGFAGAFAVCVVASGAAVVLTVPGGALNSWSLVGGALGVHQVSHLPVDGFPAAQLSYPGAHLAAYSSHDGGCLRGSDRRYTQALPDMGDVSRSMTSRDTFATVKQWYTTWFHAQGWMPVSPDTVIDAPSDGAVAWITNDADGVQQTFLLSDDGDPGHSASAPASFDTYFTATPSC